MRLIYFSLHETSDVLVLPNLHHSVSFGPIIGPLSIVVELSLVLAEAVSHAFSELAHVNVLACDQLSLSFVEVVPEVANVLMDGVRQFAVPFLCPILILSLVVLIPIQKEASLHKTVIFNLPNEDIPCCQLLALREESHLFSLVILGAALAEANLVVVPVVKEELVAGERKAVVVVFDEEGRVDLAGHYVRDLLVVKLQKIREGLGQQQAGEGNACDL